MKIKKVSGTAVLNGNVVDSLTGNSTTNAPSQRAVKELVTYSTDEIVIGTYLGKPLYRKVYTFTTSSNDATSWTEFDRSPENIENVINIYGTSTDKSNHVHPINYYESSNNYIFVMLYSNNSLRYQKKGYAVLNIKAIIEYTKTTD